MKFMNLRKRQFVYGIWAAAVMMLVCLVGCGGGMKAPSLGDLEDESPAVRIRAIKWAGDEKVEAAVPLLVDRLEEQDESVRFFAIGSLKRITGTDQGYDYKSGASQRTESVKRWRDWVKEHGVNLRRSAQE